MKSILAQSVPVAASILGILAGLAPGAAAHDLFDLSLEELGRVEVVRAVAKTDQSVADAPASVTVVSRDEIEAYGYRTLGDLLDATRGFSTSYDRSYTSVGVRGFALPSNNRRVLVLIDGRRSNENYYELAFLGTAFPVDIDLVERVEVIRGPNSALYGTNAMLAVINVVTRDPADAAAGFEVAAEGGSLATGRVRVTANGGDPGHGQWLVSGSYFRSAGQDAIFYPEFDDPASNGGVYEDNDGDQAVRFLGRYVHGGLRADVRFSSRRKEVPTGAYATLFNSGGDYIRDTLAHAGLSWEGEAADGVDYQGFVAFDHYVYVGDYIYDYPPLTVNRDETSVSTLSTEQRLAWRWGEHEILCGFEYRDDFSVEGLNFDVAPYARYVDHTADRRALGLFVQDRWRLAAWAELTAGARYDRYFGQGGSFNPRAGLVLTPRAGTTLKLLAGRAFRAPNQTELEDAGPWRENVGVGPESLDSYEFVWDEMLTPETRLSVSVYHNDFHDQIAFGPVSATGEGYFNMDANPGVTGAEFEAAYGRSRGWRCVSSLSIPSFEGLDDTPPLNTPRTMLKLRAATPEFGGGWRVGAGALRIARRPADGGGEVPGFFKLDTVLHYRGWASRGWRLALGVDNVLDEDYADPAPTQNLQLGIPQDGRTFMFRVVYGDY